jgi:hypothetical protein
MIRVLFVPNILPNVPGSVCAREVQDFLEFAYFGIHGELFIFSVRVSESKNGSLLRRQATKVITHLPKVRAVYGKIVVAEHLVARMDFRLGISSRTDLGYKGIFAVNLHAIAIVHAVWARGWPEECMRIV